MRSIFLTALAALVVFAGCSGNVGTQEETKQVSTPQAVDVHGTVTWSATPPLNDLVTLQMVDASDDTVVLSWLADPGAYTAPSWVEPGTYYFIGSYPDPLNPSKDWVVLYSGPSFATVTGSTTDIYNIDFVVDPT